MDKSDDPGGFALLATIPYFHSAKPALLGVRAKFAWGARPAGAD